MTISEPDLIAFVEGRLDPTARAAIEAAIARDPAVAAAVARLQAARARSMPAPHDTFDDPAPDELEAFIRKVQPNPAKAATIVDLAALRAARSPPPGRPDLPRWAPLAACFACGVAVAIALTSGQPGFLRADGRQVLAQGRLAQALDQDLAGPASPRSGLIRIGLSFKARDGAYCRTFATTSGEALAGLACRDRRGWTVRTAVFSNGAVTPQAPRRTADSALPPPILDAVASTIDGAPLDAAGAANARARGWRRSGG